VQKGNTTKPVAEWVGNRQMDTARRGITHVPSMGCPYMIYSQKLVSPQVLLPSGEALQNGLIQYIYYTTD
jgi:hypothetical protein